MEPIRERRWNGLPLALQITGLMFGVLVVAQLVTLALTLLMPPAPPAQYGLDDIALALAGTPSRPHVGRPLQRVLQSNPPALTGPGWLTSERSRQELAGLLKRPEADVQLFFYTPLPFAGTARPAQRAGLDEMRDGSPYALRPTKADDRRLDPIRVSYLLAQRGPAGPPPGLSFPMPTPVRPILPAPTIPAPAPAPAPAPSPAATPTPAPTPANSPPPASTPTPADSPAAVPSPSPGSPPTMAPSPSPATANPPPQAPTPEAASPAPNQATPRSTPPSADDGATAVDGPGGIPAVRERKPVPSRKPTAARDANEATDDARSPTTSANAKATVRPAPGSIPPGNSRTPRTGDIESNATTPRNTGTEASVASPSTQAQVLNGTAASLAPKAGATPPALSPHTTSSATSSKTIEPGPASTAPIKWPRLGTDAAPGTIPGLMAHSAPAHGLFGIGAAPFVEGDFIASLRVADGWIVVQPQPEPFPNAWQRRVLLWFLVSAAVVAPLAWLFSRRLVRPIVGFAAAAEQLGRDPTAPVLELRGPAEVGRAAHAFNRMQSRLRSFVDDRTAMIGAISHDLRTPLTRMRFRIEDIPDEQREGMLHEVEEMEQMISSVLAFIRDASEPGSREVLDLSTIVEDVVEDAVFVGQDVRLDDREAATVEVDAIGMRRLLGNLVENAVKYGGHARVRLFTDRHDAVAEVSDAGPGLPDDELERVFQPFYRAAGARASGKQGTGLGLAVCRSIARAHGGDVELLRGVRGLVARLRVPLAYRTTLQ